MARSSATAVAAAYVHIPFCRRRCYYCDFTIIPLGMRSGEGDSGDRFSSYVNLLCNEVRGTPVASSCGLKTLYFGGGTPSLLPIHHLRRIVDTVVSKHGIAAGAEVCMEMDPGTFDAAYLEQAAECGVTRVSLGVQSFSEELLKECGRSHGVKEVYDAISLLTSSSSQISNWSLDLISSLPHQSLKQWQHSLSEAIAAAPTHISVYDLQVEQGTKFGNLYTPGHSPLPSEEDSAELYKLASSMLRAAGYEHYEISNYAKPGYRSKHNLVYWHNQPYYAYGLGATSYIEGRRFSRSKKMKEYAAYVEEQLSSTAAEGVPAESLEERLLDCVMLSLRLAEGIDLGAVEEEFSKDAASTLREAAREYEQSGHLEVAEGSIRLTDPQGFLVSSEIISLLFNRMSQITAPQRV